MIFFKAEANNKIGRGHFERSIALAKELISAGIESSFIFSDTPQPLIEKILEAGFPVHIIDINKQLDSSSYLNIIPQNSLIVFDTDDNRFYFGPLIDDLRKRNIKTACYSISDLYTISTDILINPNIVSQIHKYNTESYTRKYLGTQYLIYRNEFRELAPKFKEYYTPLNLLLIFGNADSNHLTMYFLDVIEKLGNILNKVNIVAGILNPDLEKIKSKVNEIKNIETELHINTNKIISIYEETDVAITAAGMAMWEMALFNIPQMVIASSRREIEYAKYLSDLNYIYSLGVFSDISSSDEMAKKIIGILKSETLKELKSEEFQSIIDPNGIKNIVDVLIGEMD